MTIFRIILNPHLFNHNQSINNKILDEIKKGASTSMFNKNKIKPKKKKIDFTTKNINHFKYSIYTNKKIKNKHLSI